MVTYSESQYVFWDIFDRVSAARCERSVAQMRWIQLVAREPENTIEVDAAAIALRDSLVPLIAAEDEMSAFCSEHLGESFLLFRPDRIQAAITADIQPLNLPRFDHPTNGGMQ